MIWRRPHQFPFYRLVGANGHTGMSRVFWASLEIRPTIVVDVSMFPDFQEWPGLTFLEE